MTTMKLRIIFIFLVGAMASIQANGQSSRFDDIRLAIKSGDSKALVKYFDAIAGLTTDSEEGSYSKNQADFVLTNFFKKYPPAGFVYNHQGASPGGVKYTIGTYKSGSVSFRVYMKLKKVGEEYVINTLGFTKE